MTERNNQQDFKVLNHRYENTGGNTMLSIFAVYFPQENITRYAMANEESCGLYTTDFVMTEQEVDYDDSMMLAHYDYSKLHEAGDLLALVEHCRFEFIKKDSRYCGRPVYLRPEELPPYLQDPLPAGYLEWLANEDQLAETDGYTVRIKPGFRQPFGIAMDDEPDAIAAEQFLAYMDGLFAAADFENETAAGQEALDAFYDLKATITFGEQSVTFGNCAAVFTGIQEALKYIIDQQ